MPTGVVELDHVVIGRDLQSPLKQQLRKHELDVVQPFTSIRVVLLPSRARLRTPIGTLGERIDDLPRSEHRRIFERAKSKGVVRVIVGDAHELHGALKRLLQRSPEQPGSIRAHAYVDRHDEVAQNDRRRVRYQPRIDRSHRALADSL